MRSFVALDLSEGAARAIATRQAGLPAGRAIPPENLHLTLAFLGDQPQPALADLDAELDIVRAAPVPVRLQGLDIFGGTQGGALALLARPDPELLALERTIGAALRRAGILLKRRSFKPHVSIARLSRDPVPGQAARIQDWITARAQDPEIAFTASHFSLYRSDLDRDGARYTALAQYPLGDRGDYPSDPLRY